VVQEFFRQEREYEDLLRGGGFVCNNLGLGISSHRVHRANCTMLNNAGPARPGARTTVRKAGSRRLDDLWRWLIDNYGREGLGFQYCAFCRPQDA
jgi:3-methyladenine DNA glycosylase Mpg